MDKTPSIGYLAQLSLGLILISLLLSTFICILFGYWGFWWCLERCSHFYHQLNGCRWRGGNPIPTDASEMIYPNPTDGIINIKMNQFKEATIYNLSGKRIKRSTDNRIDISSFSEGVYYWVREYEWRSLFDDVNQGLILIFFFPQGTNIFNWPTIFAIFLE